MASRAVAVDSGSHSMKVLLAKEGRSGLEVLRFAVEPKGRTPRESSAALAGTGIKLNDTVIGLAGREMTLRYSQVPPSPDWQLKNLMDLEIQDLSEQSGGELSADFNLLPIDDEDGGMETVLLALARDDALGAHNELISGAGGAVTGHVPNCIALYNAYQKCVPTEADEVVCLVSIGRDTIDLAIARGLDLLFARNLSGGGKVIDDAIASGFGVSERKAESLKRELIDLDPSSRGNFASGQAEKVTLAAGGAASAIASGIQSSLAFCKSQTQISELSLDKVLVCGGSARLRGLMGMLRESLRCPVELLDPWDAVDLSALDDEDAELLEANKLEAVVALGLAAGRIDDSLYALEILPEAVRKKQRFKRRTVWNIAAGAIAVGLLAFSAKTASEQSAKATSAQRVAIKKRQAAENVHGDAETLIESNKQKQQLVEAMGALVTPLDGTLRTLRALDETLPEPLWIEKIELKKGGGRPTRRGSRGSRSGGGRTAGPADDGVKVVVQGQGRELNGVDVTSVYNAFSVAFRNFEGIATLTPTTEPADRGIEFMFEVGFTEKSEPAVDNVEDQ